MKKWLLLFMLPALLVGCKGKKKQLSDDEGITTEDFIGFFDDVKAPYTVADSSFQKKHQDTASISYKTFHNIVPDSVLQKPFGKNGRPKLYPIGKMAQKKGETYLLLKAIGNAQNAAYVLVFDEAKKFVASMPLLINDNNPATHQTAVMDNRFSITTNTEYKAADGRAMYRKATYAYNISGTGAFALILTESNETIAARDMLNPIDTLQRKNKLAGDYVQNKFNIVSVRDSKKQGELLIFVHFETPGGKCKGEIKGEAKIIAPNKALYKQAGDQCELELNFSGSTVSLQETNCGSHRDIKCFFEGTYTKKTPPKPAKKIKKTT